MDLINKIDNKLNEGVSLISIADSFARYLMGDKNVAISELKRYSDLPHSKNLSKMDAKEYNDAYTKLFHDIHKAISMNMKKVRG